MFGSHPSDKGHKSHVCSSSRALFSQLHLLCGITIILEVTIFLIIFPCLSSSASLTTPLPLTSRLSGESRQASPVCSSDIEVTGDDVIDPPPCTACPDVVVVLKQYRVMTSLLTSTSKCEILPHCRPSHVIDGRSESCRPISPMIPESWISRCYHVHSEIKWNETLKINKINRYC